MGFGDDIRRDVLDEGFLRLERVLAVGGEPESFADTEDVGIHRHGGLVPYDRAHYIRCLPTDPLQGLQVIDVIGHLAVVYFHEPLRHLHEMLCFGAGITDRLDIFKDFIGGSCG